MMITLIRVLTLSYTQGGFKMDNMLNRTIVDLNR